MKINNKKFSNADKEMIINFYIDRIKFFGIDYMKNRIKNFLRNPREKSSAYKFKSKYFIISNLEQVKFHEEAIRRYELKMVKLENDAKNILYKM